MKLIMIFSLGLLAYVVYYFIIPIGWLICFFVSESLKDNEYKLGQRTGDNKVFSVEIKFRNVKKYPKVMFINTYEYEAIEPVKLRDIAWDYVTFYIEACKHAKTSLEKHMNEQ